MQCGCSGKVTTAQGRFDQVQFLLEHGANPNLQTMQGVSPLHLATAICSPDLVALLVQWGADFNARGSGGRTPLHVAATLRQYTGQTFSRQSTIDAVLAIPGIGIDLRDEDGCTPYLNSSVVHCRLS
jgi:ankyrin repeat protein